jgi:hypothetical protein
MFWLALLLGVSGLIVWNLMRVPVLGGAAQATFVIWPGR